MEKKYKNEEDFDDLKEKIQTIIDPVNQCKEPMSVLKNKLIEKYLKKYLDMMASPKTPSFNYDNLDVLQHPEVYTLKSDKFAIPDFDSYDVTTGNQEKYVLLPKDRKVKLEPLSEEIQE